MKAREKILFVVNRYYPEFVGGAEISVQTLVEEVASRGIDVVVVSLAPGEHNVSDEVNGVRVYRLATKNIYKAFAGAKSPLSKAFWHLRDIWNSSMASEFGKILDSEAPTWVSTHTIAGLSVAVWNEVSKRGMGHSHALHDYYLLCPLSTMFRRSKNCIRQCNVCKAFSHRKKRASQGVHTVIGISEYVLRRHCDLGYFTNARKAVIYNARKFHLNPGIPKRRASGEPIRFGYIGRLHKSKGVESMLDAISQLPAASWSLRLAGGEVEPGYSEYLRKTYDRQEIEFLGYQRPETFYPQIDALIVPSVWNEPLGMVAVEGFGYGVPVIAARSGGLPEIIGRGGPGWLFDPGDVAGLLQVLRSLEQDRAILEEKRVGALERRTYFSPTRQCDEFLANTIYWGRYAT